MGFVALDFSLKSYLGFSEISYGFIESPLFFHIVGLLGLGVFGELAKKAARQKLAAEAEFIRQDSGTLHLPRELLVHVYVFIHLFSGPRRPGDFEEWVRRLCAERGFDCVVISYDPLISEKFDILSNAQFSMIRKLAYSGRVDGEHGGPVCATWSRLRHLPGGPPPLRSRRQPFWLPGLSSKNKESLRRGSEFFLRQMDICEGVFRFFGHTHSTEHPKDPKGKYPSIWATPQWK